MSSVHSAQCYVNTCSVMRTEKLRYFLLILVPRVMKRSRQTPRHMHHITSSQLPRSSRNVPQSCNNYTANSHIGAVSRDNLDEHCSTFTIQQSFFLFFRSNGRHRGWCDNLQSALRPGYEARTNNQATRLNKYSTASESECRVKAESFAEIWHTRQQ